MDILAPGEDIVSLSPNGSPMEMTGTSMSAAHVTGAAALYLAQNPSASPAQVEQALIDAAQSFVTGNNGSTTNKSVWVGSSTPQTYRDEFNAISYSGNDGTQNWSGNWQEIGENDGPGDGRIEVGQEVECPSGICLTIKAKEANRGVRRAVDLSGALSATLTFDSRRDELATNNVHLEVSSDGGASWTLLKTYAAGTDNSPQQESFDLTSFISANTQIRFFVSTNGDKKLRVDNIEIEVNGGGGASKMRTKY